MRAIQEPCEIVVLQPVIPQGKLGDPPEKWALGQSFQPRWSEGLSFAFPDPSSQSREVLLLESPFPQFATGRQALDTVQAVMEHLGKDEASPFLNGRGRFAEPAFRPVA